MLKIILNDFKENYKVFIKTKNYNIRIRNPEWMQIYVKLNNQASMWYHNELFRNAKKILFAEFKVM